MLDVAFRGVLVFLFKFPAAVMLAFPLSLRLGTFFSLRGFEDSVIEHENYDADSQKCPPDKHDGKRDIRSVIMPGHKLAGL